MSISPGKKDFTYGDTNSQYLSSNKKINLTSIIQTPDKNIGKQKANMNLSAQSKNNMNYVNSQINSDNKNTHSQQNLKSSKIFDMITQETYSKIYFASQFQSRITINSQNKEFEKYLREQYNIQKYIKEEKFKPNKSSQIFDKNNKENQNSLIYCIICEEFVRAQVIEKHSNYCQARHFLSYHLNNPTYFTDEMKLENINIKLRKIIYLLEHFAQQIRDYTPQDKNIREYEFYFIEIISQIIDKDSEQYISRLDILAQDTKKIIDVIDKCFSIKQELVILNFKAYDKITEKIDLIKSFKAK